MTTDLETLERDFEALRAAIQDLQARKAQHEASLARIEDERVETEARIALAEREAAALAQRLQEQEEELEQARTQAAIEEFESDVMTMQATAEGIASAIDALLASFDGFDQHLERLEERKSALAARGVKVTAPPEPEVLHDAWQRLVRVVRETINEQFEDELVEAAVRSPRPGAINELPVHLQEIARQRWREARRAKLARDA